MLIYGINPVIEAVRAGRVQSVTISDRAGIRLRDLLRLAETHGIPIRRAAPAELDRRVRSGRHQGVIAEVEEPQAVDLAEIVKRTDQPVLIVVLDQIEDPRNLGAIVRSVDAAGAHCVVLQDRHTAALDGSAGKASAGAIAHVPIVRVVNIARALRDLKQLGVWTVGLAAEGTVPYDQVDWRLPTAFVVGAEGSGMRRLVKEQCDLIARIPMHGHVDSLNVSVAAGVVLFEAARQRASAGVAPASRGATPKT